MLRDIADLVRNLIDGDSKPKPKPRDPLRAALTESGGKPATMEEEIGLILHDPFNLGFAIVVLKTGHVWHLPDGKVQSMYRKYLAYSDLQGGSTMQDIVEGLGCAIVVFHVEVMNVGVRVHMPRRSVRVVIDKLRLLREKIIEFNKKEVADHQASSIPNKIMREPFVLSFRVIAYEGERVFRNAFLR